MKRYMCVAARVGVRCSSVVEFAHGVIGRRIDPFKVDQWSYLFFHSVQQRPWYVLSWLWNGAYKIFLAANRKE